VGKEVQMADENRIERIRDDHNVEERSLGLAVTQAAVAGVSGGVAGALTNQAFNALRKPKDEQQKKD
jgi:hypothetical protein